MRGNFVVIVTVLLFPLLLLTSCGSDEPPSGLPSVYLVSQDCVKDGLLAPTSAAFPDYDESFVKYNSSVLEDLGEGQALEYRIYDVNAYVDSQNTFGVMVRANYHVQVYDYVDDYNSPQFGEEGIHKGIKDHCYCYLLSLD